MSGHMNVLIQMEHRYEINTAQIIPFVIYLHM